MITINVDEQRTEVWNTRSLERVASLPIDISPGVRSTFRDYSLVLYDYAAAVAYSYLDDLLYSFELDEYREYIDAFPGGVLMAGFGDNRYRDMAEDEAYRLDDDAIYRWTPDEGETLLLKGAIPITTEW
jgi:hypothetical protein